VGGERDRACIIPQSLARKGKGVKPGDAHIWNGVQKVGRLGKDALSTERQDHRYRPFMGGEAQIIGRSRRKDKHRENTVTPQPHRKL